MRVVLRYGVFSACWRKPEGQSVLGDQCRWTGLPQVWLALLDPEETVAIESVPQSCPPVGRDQDSFCCGRVIVPIPIRRDVVQTGDTVSKAVLEGRYVSCLAPPSMNACAVEVSIKDIGWDLRSSSLVPWSLSTPIRSTLLEFIHQAAQSQEGLLCPYLGRA